MSLLRRVCVVFAMSAMWLIWTSSTTMARTFNVVTYVTLSAGGRPIANLDVYSSYVALIMATKHFNERNSSILSVMSELGSCDAQLNLLGGLFDDELLSSVAMPHFINLLNGNNIDFINGVLRVNVIETVGITAGTLGIPLVSYLASTEKLNNKELYPTLFRLLPSDAQYIQAIAKLFDYLGYRVVAIVVTFDSTGTDYRRLMQSACEERNIRLRTYGFDPTLRGDELEASMNQQIGALAAEKVNIIFRIFTRLELEIAYAKAVIAHNWLDGKLHLSRYSVSPYDLIRAAPPEDVTFLKQLYNGSLAVRITYDLNAPTYEAFVKAWPTFDVDYVNQFFPNKTTPSGQSLLLPDDFFSTVDADGFLTFAIAYDSVITLGLAACGSSSDMNENLRDVAFEGITGTIHFNVNQSRIQEAEGINTVLFNLVHDDESPEGIAVNTVGVYADNQWKLSDEIVYSGGRTSPPQDLERDPVTINRVPLGAIIWGYIEAVIGILLGVFSMYLLFGHWTTQSFQKAQPFYLIFMGIGAILLAMSILALVVETDVGCVLFNWFFFLGYTLVLTSLCAKGVHTFIAWRDLQRAKAAGEQEKKKKKLSQSSPGGAEGTMRTDIPSMVTVDNTSPNSDNNNSNTSNNNSATNVNDVANAAERTPGNGSPQSSNTELLRKKEISKRKERVVLVVLLAVILTVTGCLAASTAITPLRFYYVVTQRDVDGFPLAASATCVSGNANSGRFTITLVVIVGVLTIVTFGVGFKVRNAPLSNFDANMSAVAGLCVFELFFVGLPLLIAVNQTALARFLVVSSMAFLINLTVVFTMFVPKAYSWKFRAWNLVPMDSRSENSQQRQSDNQSRVQTQGTGDQPAARGVLRADLPQYRSTASHWQNTHSKSSFEFVHGHESTLASRIDAKSYAISQVPEEQSSAPSSGSDNFPPVPTPQKVMDPSAENRAGVSFAHLDGPRKKLPSFVNFETLNAAAPSPPAPLAFGATTQPALGMRGGGEYGTHPATGMIAPPFHSASDGVVSSHLNLENSSSAMPVALNEMSSFSQHFGSAATESSGYHDSRSEGSFNSQVLVQENKSQSEEKKSSASSSALHMT